MWVMRQRPTFAAEPKNPWSVEEFDEECANHKARVVERIAYLKQALQR